MGCGCPAALARALSPRHAPHPGQGAPRSPPPPPQRSAPPGRPDVGSGDAGGARSPAGPGPSRQAGPGGPSRPGGSWRGGRRLRAARIPPRPQECSLPRPPRPRGRGGGRARGSDGGEAGKIAAGAPRPAAWPQGPGGAGAGGRGSGRRPEPDSLPPRTGDKDTQGAQEARCAHAPPRSARGRGGTQGVTQPAPPQGCWLTAQMGRLRPAPKEA